MNIHTAAENAARHKKAPDVPFLYALDSKDTAQLLTLCRILSSWVDVAAHALTVYALEDGPSAAPRYFLSVRGELPKQAAAVLLEYGRRIISGLPTSEHAVLLYLKEHAKQIEVAPLS